MKKITLFFVICIILYSTINVTGQTPVKILEVFSKSSVDGIKNMDASGEYDAYGVGNIDSAYTYSPQNRKVGNKVLGLKGSIALKDNVWMGGGKFLISNPFTKAFYHKYVMGRHTGSTEEPPYNFVRNADSIYVGDGSNLDNRATFREDWGGGKELMAGLFSERMVLVDTLTKANTPISGGFAPQNSYFIDGKAYFTSNYGVECKVTTMTKGSTVLNREEYPGVFCHTGFFTTVISSTEIAMVVGSYTPEYELHLLSPNNTFVKKLTFVPRDYGVSKPVKGLIKFDNLWYIAIDATKVNGVATNGFISYNPETGGVKEIAMENNTKAYDISGIYGLNNNLYIPMNTGEFFTKSKSVYVIKSNNTVPVKLTSFRGESVGGKKLLQWETAEESNTSHFEIEKSVDGVTFTTTGNVPAKGNSTTIQKYSYSDGSVGTNYYRLKIVDKDGSFELSKIIKITGNNLAAKVKIYPNPMKDIATVEIQSNTPSQISLQVFDLQGRLMKQENHRMMVGENRLQVNVSMLTSGVYLLKLSGDRKITVKIQKE